MKTELHAGARTVPLLTQFETLLLNCIVEVEQDYWVSGPRNA
ncbi:hypothetical protein QP735_06810 [Curtobacterium citreum]|nr:hypothetical protein [Curtobacterium citreum]MDK8172239.1 hypothetical protein [Curtobacterium citreum]